VQRPRAALVDANDVLLLGSGASERVPARDAAEVRRASLTAAGCARGAQRQTLVARADGDGAYALDLAGARPRVARYDFAHEQWTALELELPAPLLGLGVAEHAGALWLFGGALRDVERGGDAALPSERVYRWQQGSSAGFEHIGLLPRPRRDFGGAVLHERYYLIGGTDGTGAPVEECDVLDLDSHAWSAIPAPRRTRVSPSLVALGSRLYLAGGTSAAEPDPSIEVFSPSTGKWSVLVEELPISPRDVVMVAWRDALVLCSSAPGERIELAIVRP
jgi:hypothetical protein